METYTQNQQQQPQPSEQEKLKCPRCDSMNTKFCYYNNYNLSQPRHFCKGCRRYWTKGGALRNIPVGGGSKKSASKRGSSAKRTPSASASTEEKSEHETFLSLNGDYFGQGQGQGQYGNFVGMGGKDEGYFGQGQYGNFGEMGLGSEFGQGQFGSFAGMGVGYSSMLVGSSSGPQFGGLLDGFGLGGPSLREGNYFGDLSLGHNVIPQTDGFLNIGGGSGDGSGDWDDGGDGGWPDLAI